MNFAIDKDVNNFMKGFAATDQGGFEDPTYLGFRFVFDFDPTFRDFATSLTTSPLFAPGDGDLESAARYLRANAYPVRAKMIEEFKESLRYINSQTPWYWQSIDGLADLWKVETGGENFNPFRGKDKVLTIACNESIDLRITALADLYRKASFDPQLMRNLLPKNLRHFSMKIQLAEMRSFHRIKNAAKDVPLNPNIINQNANLNEIGMGYKDKFETINNLISILEFDLSMCEFDFSESFPMETVSNVDMEAAKQKFKIKVGRIKEIHTYKLLDLILGEGPIETRMKVETRFRGQFLGQDPLAQRAPDMDAAFNRRNPSQAGTLINGYVSDIRTQIENLGPNFIARNVNRVNEFITSTILGNVYGDSRNQNLESLINSFGKKTKDGLDILGNAFEGLASKVDTVVDNIGDIYPNVPGSDQLLGPVKTIGNIYKT